MIHFTSDSHWGHANIIKYCNRPFKNVWEMNHVLIEKWNAVVKPTDTVYHLGDFAFLAPRQIKDLLKCLNGNITMVLGNHDGPAHNYPGVTIVKDSMSLKLEDGTELFMTHYPEVAEKEGFNKLSLCGHIHTAWRSWKPREHNIIYNVGVDAWNYQPITIDDIYKDMDGIPLLHIYGAWKDPHGVEYAKGM